MHESTDKLTSLTSSANEQSDSNPHLSTTHHDFDPDKYFNFDIADLIKQKDLQIASLQTTIERQSLQIQQQTAAIDGLQLQISELSANLAALMNRSGCPPPAPKLAPVFVKRNAGGKKPKGGVNNKRPSSSALSASSQPNVKRPRNLLDDHDFDSIVTDSVSNDENQSTTALSAKVTDDTENDVNNKLPNTNETVNSGNDFSNNDINSTCPDDQLSKDDINYVNFKKNSITKDKDVTPIEISINGNEKGSLHTLLVQQFGNNNFLWSNAGKKGIRINPFTHEIKANIMLWLKSRQYLFHTFLSKECKPNAFIIRGLPSSVSHDHVLSALQQGGIDVTALERHSTGYTRFHHIQSDLWRVTTPNAVTINHFKAIDGILNVKIKIEVLRRTTVIQCKNCQLFFHSAAGCYRKFRCVKCDKDHPPGSCPRNADKSLPVTCCNCHKNHSANDLRNCEFFTKNIQPIISKRESIRNESAGIRTSKTKPAAPIFPATVKQNLSFANVVRSEMPSNSTAHKKITNQHESQIHEGDLKQLLIQNLQLMSAQQELFHKLSCLVA